MNLFQNRAASSRRAEPSGRDPRRWLRLAFLPLLILLIQGCPPSARTRPPFGGRSGPFSVNGFIVAATNPAAEERQRITDLADYVFVPGVEVWLRNELTGEESPRVRTDLSGRFTFPPRKIGGYRVCWEAEGFVNGCVGPTFAVLDKHMYLGPSKIRVERHGGYKTIFGRVRFADGSLPRAFEPLANVNAFARVHALHPASDQSLASAVYVNNFGDYLLPQVWAGAPVKLEARIEAASGSSLIGGIPASGSHQRVDLTLRNSPPQLSGLLGQAPGNRRWTANPNDAVDVSALAEDPDGDTVRYQWILPDGMSLIGPADFDTVTTRLPGRKGVYEATVIAYDGKGGYARETLKISTLGVRFAGTVSGTDAPVVAGAGVEVNGVAATTDAQGHFEVTVKESERYVLNIRRQGYALVSKIYDQGLTGGRWTLTRATVSSEDPTATIDVIDTRRPSDCPGALSDRLDRQGNPRKRECGPGVRVVIPANSLVDEDGNPPPPGTLVQVSRSTIDVEAPDGMPGDLTVINQSGDVQAMETYGAGFTEITAGGKEYNLDAKNGATAEVTVPVPPSVLASGVSLPPTVPLLSYDETRGVWLEEGVATRTGNAYRAQVRHFSAYNIDLLKTNQACLRLETVVMPPSFNLEIKVLAGGGGGASTVTHLITNGIQRFHVLYNLPTTQTVELRAFEVGPATPIPFLVSGASSPLITVPPIPTQNPTTPNQPVFPYAACSKSVELTPFRLPPSTVDTFLAGLYNFRAANLTELEASAPGSSGPWLAAADAYYDTIDPQDKRLDLEDFKLTNGFPGGEVTALYANSADLGFGREMHCRRQAVGGLPGFDVACYVTNFGDRFTDDNQDFIDAVNNTAPIATVGMEYSRIENQLGPGYVSNARVVKFYVFKAAQPSPILGHSGFGRATSANLDGFGERPVPQLCMTCHGGRYPVGGGGTGVPTWDPNNPSTANLGSSFIPFDLTGLHTPVYSGTDYKVTQQDEFKRLNTEMVWETGNLNAIREVIEKMYGGAGFPLNDQVEGFAVAGWDVLNPLGTAVTEPTPRDTYAQVVGPSCRSCHITQAPSGIAWDDRSQWVGNSFIASLVCNSHKMPHAIATHNRFWLSTAPHQPIVMHDFLNGTGTPVGSGIALDCKQ